MNIKIAFIDLDGTLIKGQSQAMFIKFLKGKKLISNLRSCVILLWFFLYKIKIVSNPSKILAYALFGFKNKPLKDISNCTEEFMTTIIRPHYYKDVTLFLDSLRSKSIRAVILSTSVDVLVERIAKDLNIEESISTKVEVVNGAFTGKIIGSQVYSVKKLDKINEYIRNKNIHMEEVLVVADNYSDEEILREAGIGVVANPDKKMRRWALQNNLQMIYLDKYEPIQYI